MTSRPSWLAHGFLDSDDAALCFETVMLHEYGHLYGLGNNDVPASVMNRIIRMEKGQPHKPGPVDAQTLEAVYKTR